MIYRVLFKILALLLTNAALLGSVHAGSRTALEKLAGDYYIKANELEVDFMLFEQDMLRDLNNYSISTIQDQFTIWQEKLTLFHNKLEAQYSLFREDIFGAIKCLGKTKTILLKLKHKIKRTEKRIIRCKNSRFYYALCRAKYAIKDIPYTLKFKAKKALLKVQELGQNTLDWAFRLKRHQTQKVVK